MASLTPFDAPPVSLRGMYRVQGSLRPGPSELEGQWLEPHPRLLDDAAINAHLARHPLWAGTFRCVLRPVHVHRREGEFARRPDILYKRSHFQPAPGSPAMACDIVDVNKACTAWGRRRAVVSAWLGAEASTGAFARIGDLPRTVANEYFVHEAGHGLGYDVDRKGAEGYFHPGGRAAPGLLALEELRADLQGLGVALHLLPTGEAVAVLLYQLLLRLGVHIEAMAERRPAPYGLVPYLLYRALCMVGVDLGHARGQTLVFDVPRMVEVMVSLSHHAQSLLTRPEAEAEDRVGAAMSSAAYLRAALSDTPVLERFEQAMQAAVIRLQPRALSTA